MKGKRLVGGRGGFSVGGGGILVELTGGHTFVGGEGFVLALGFGGGEFLLDFAEGFVDGGSGGVGRRKSLRAEALSYRVRIR